MTNYLWNGRPVAYLDPDPLNTGFNVYGFDGTHLGWYDGGVWDHEGGGSCAIKERTLSAEPEPFKLV